MRMLIQSLFALNEFFSMATPATKKEFNMGMIQKARKLNQRAKAQKRGAPTAGHGSYGTGRVFCVGTYINPQRQAKKAEMKRLGLTGKSYKRSLKAQKKDRKRWTIQNF